ncbi:hypothetical protein [Sediminicola luteus]|uniref:hypothetical protein n=1 Tax=Sediminicola luteus TaxID=319238 RepID=UPI001FE67227|nr:hypothetical protein [Sediminicola luteus]
MKNSITKIVPAFLLGVALLFTSCQDEFEEVELAQQEADSFAATSPTANLIMGTTAKDGSYDNIIDEASCIALKFPYTVNVNGLDVTVDDMEDLELIEELLDKLDGKKELMELIFPLTITLSDYTEVVINNKEELYEHAKACVEGGDDDDVECIDFVYPIKLYTFDINEVQTGTVTVNHDKELRRFFAGLEVGNLVGFEFPINLTLYDGSEVVVNSNAELAHALEAAKEACDEDDDNDHNDDDFEDVDLDELLMTCSWKVLEVKRNNQDNTPQYEAYRMKFKPEGEVVVHDREGNVLNGTWSTRMTDAGAMINLEFDTLVDFTLDWKVYELEEGKIKLYGDDGNRIVMKKHCAPIIPSPETLREIMAECHWIIKDVKHNNMEVNRLLGLHIEFQADNVAILTDRLDFEKEGEWELTSNDKDQRVLAISFEDEPELNFEWLLSHMEEERMKFQIEEYAYELKLERNCDDDANDEDVAEIKALLDDSLWKITLFEENEDPGTEMYADLTFQFKYGGELAVTQNEDPIDTGRWVFYRNAEGGLEMIISFANTSNMYPLANDYQVYEVKDGTLKLKHYNGDQGKDYLTFEQIQ